MAQKGKQSNRQGKKAGKETQARKRESRAQQTSSKRRPETAIAQREQSSPVNATLSPFSLMRRFSEEMDRLFGDFSFAGGLETSTWLPQVEVSERNGTLSIRADLPGLTRNDIDVDITDDAVVIRGERQQVKEENEEGYYRSERSYGSFYREIPLPTGVNPEEANATFRDGVLEITMPAFERQTRSRRIEIGEGSQAEQQPQAKTKAAGA
jgi:HSP20 family protein